MRNSMNTLITVFIVVSTILQCTMAKKQYDQNKKIEEIETKLNQYYPY